MGHLTTITLAALLASCGASPPITAGGDAFLQCGKQDLTRLVGDQTLLATIAEDLLGDDYEKAISDLIGRIGKDAVGCAVLAVDAVLGVHEKSRAPKVTAPLPQETRARTLIAKYGWHLAPGGK